MLQQVPDAWDIWQTETVGRALGDLGREPVWYYLPEIVVQALPWSVLLWKAGRDSYRRAWKEGDTRERFLWVWFVTQFVILTASAFKHHHYLMAAMPAISLILGRTLAEVWTGIRNGSLVVTGKQIGFLAGVVVAVGVAVAVGISLSWPDLTNNAIGLAACWIATGLLASYLLWQRCWTRYLGTMGLGLMVCYAILMSTVFPNRDSRLPQVAFAQDVRQTVRASQPICVYGLKEEPLVYYLDGPVFRGILRGTQPAVESKRFVGAPHR